MFEGRACCVSRAAGQATDGTTATVASTRGGSKEECYGDTQAKTSKAEAEGGLFYTLIIV